MIMMIMEPDIVYTNKHGENVRGGEGENVIGMEMEADLMAQLWANIDSEML